MESMNVTLPPEGGEQKLTAKPTSPESLERQEEQELMRLVELIQNATTEEELAKAQKAVEAYIENRNN